MDSRYPGALVGLRKTTHCIACSIMRFSSGVCETVLAGAFASSRIVRAFDPSPADCAQGATTKRINQRKAEMAKPVENEERRVVDFPRLEGKLSAEGKHVHANYFQLSLRKPTKSPDESTTSLEEKEDSATSENVEQSTEDTQAAEHDAQLFEYVLDGIPVGINRTRQRRLFQDASRSIPFLHNNTSKWATDHLKTVIAWEPIHSAETALRSGDGNEGTQWGPYNVNDGKVRNGVQPQTQLRIRFVRKLDPHELETFSQGEGPPRLWESSPEVKAVNMILSKCFNAQNMIQIGSNKFFHNSRALRWLQPGDSDQNTDTTGSLFTFRGYSFTVKPARGGILLNVNTVTSAFFRERTVAQFLTDEKTITDFNKRRAALVGARVLVTYGRGRTLAERQAGEHYKDGRIKPIQSVSDHSISAQRFVPGPNQAAISVSSYLRTTYGHTFDKHQLELRAINLGTVGKPSWFSPTHLKLLPNQPFKRLLPEGLVDSMLTAAAKTPEDNKAWIQKVLNDTGILTVRPVEGESLPIHKTLDHFSTIQIQKELLKVKGTTLPRPIVIYKDNTRQDQESETEPQPKTRWNMKSKHLLRSGLSNSTIRPYLLTATGYQYRSSSDMVKTYGHYLHYQLKSLGLLQLEDTDFKHISMAHTGESALVGALESVKTDSSSLGEAALSPVLVILIIPKRDIAVYQCFKDLADRTYGFHSICTTEAPNYHSQYVPPKGKQREYQIGDERAIVNYFANSVMKLNLKFGGINHTTKDVRSRMKDTLDLGADLSHPGPGAIQGCPSIAAIVGSINDGGKYLGSMRLQTLDRSDREILHFAEEMVRERLEAWRAAHDKLPTNIIYFRDGVSEGQYAKVKKVKLGAIRSAYASLRKSEDPTSSLKITAIVAAKRHNTRFYPVNEDDEEGRAKNCRPGTLVDDMITSPFFRDFYLQSHSALQGTAKPTHYFILEDEIGMGVTKLQRFTHDICFTYARATLGVSYAAPAFYADRLCDRGRAYFRDFLNGELTLKRRFNANKAAVEQRSTAMRRAMFSRSASEPKTPDERVFDVLEKEDIAKACREWTIGEVMKVWRADGKNENPWHESVGESMFWM